LTFAATANVIVHCGAKPVFVEVDAETGLIDPSAAAAAITEKTRAIIPVHLYGRAADVESLRALSEKHNLYFLADCAHAIETRYKDKHISSWADAAAFSFYATKNLAVGEGGMLTSNDKSLIEKLRRLSLHGMSQNAFGRDDAEGYSPYDIVEAGYKFNMTDISAALGLEQLKRIGTHFKRRCEIWDQYNSAFKSTSFRTPAPISDDMVHGRHLYTLHVEPSKRSKVLSAIKSQNIGVGVHFTSLHLSTFYQKEFNYQRGDFPNAESFSDSVFSIPLTPYLSSKDVEYVIDAVKSAES
ncbi:MAG: DegT/DnrJ/EryC1/StrS family aminotransferase, partial [Candidatus Lindowbacteria bacterium]|nr:DegT/DnrJ/EryC1/StrS family aminotransferase [Candidatus Lindowbacteria bacterium]